MFWFSRIRSQGCRMHPSLTHGLPEQPLQIDILLEDLIMLKYVISATVLAVLAFAPMSQAKTPDGKTPAEETVCDELEGALYGLCVAYCEAMDCDHSEHWASDRACEQVLTNFMKHSPDAFPPCMEMPDDEEDNPTLPES
jgi:hypothetical protein